MGTFCFTLYKAKNRQVVQLLVPSESCLQAALLWLPFIDYHAAKRFVKHSTGLKAQLCVQDSTAQHRPASSQTNCCVGCKLCSVQWSGSLSLASQKRQV